MTDWIPSAEQVRSHYVFNQSNQWEPERGEAFDRWLAEHDAKVRAEEREKSAQVAEEFDPAEAALAGRYAGKDIAARIREQT